MAYFNMDMHVQTDMAMEMDKNMEIGKSMDMIVDLPKDMIMT